MHQKMMLLLRGTKDRIHYVHGYSYWKGKMPCAMQECWLWVWQHTCIWKSSPAVEWSTILGEDQIHTITQQQRERNLPTSDLDDEQIPNLPIVPTFNSIKLVQYHFNYLHHKYITGSQSWCHRQSICPGSWQLC